MLLKFSLVTALTPLVTALLVSVPKNHIALGEAVTFTWDFTPNVDPTTFSLALINQDQNTKYVLSDNIDSTIGQVTLAMPIFIPVGDNYIFEASRVFETIGIIHIGPGDALFTPYTFCINRLTVHPDSISFRELNAEVISLAGLNKE